MTNTDLQKIPEPKIIWELEEGVEYPQIPYTSYIPKRVVRAYRRLKGKLYVIYKYEEAQFNDSMGKPIWKWVSIEELPNEFFHDMYAALKAADDAEIQTVVSLLEQIAAPTDQAEPVYLEWAQATAKSALVALNRYKQK